jgi:hypothetical protein
MFFVGQTGDKKEQGYIREENLAYGDITQGHFTDHYNNLTLKTLSMLEWIKDNCSEVCRCRPKKLLQPITNFLHRVFSCPSNAQASFVLKTDDDMYINVPKLMEFMDRHASENNSIYGRLAQNWKPDRNQNGRNFLPTSEYPGDVLPDFCTGPAYMMTGDVIPKLFREGLRLRYMRTEDVLVTGIAAQNAKVRRVDVPEFTNLPPDGLPTPCILDRTITFHDISPEKLYDYWTTVRTKGSDCP